MGANQGPGWALKGPLWPNPLESGQELASFVSLAKRLLRRSPPAGIAGAASNAIRLLPNRLGVSAH
jgi:hypothetical protein